MINTDKNQAYGQAIKVLKQEGSLASDVSHLQIKYRNTGLKQMMESSSDSLILREGIQHLDV